jgi:hypothetical protein
MPDSSPPSVTELLQAWSAGDQQALGLLVPMVYADLRRMAKRRIASERECVPEPSSLVNELYVRLAGSHGLSFRNRTEFFGLAAQLLRRILVDAQGRAAVLNGAEARRELPLRKYISPRRAETANWWLWTMRWRHWQRWMREKSGLWNCVSLAA